MPFFRNTPSRCTHFLDLPVEIIVTILLELDVKALCACKAACSYLQHIIHTSSSIQYQFELVEYGYSDIISRNGVGPPLHVRRERLKTHQENWQNLRWTETRTSAVHGTRRQLTGGVYAVQGTPRSLSFIQLPSAIRGVENSRTWGFIDLGMETMDFCLDVEQDLLLLIKDLNPMNIAYRPETYVRTLSSNTRHPRTRREILELPEYPVPSARCDPHIMGSKVAVFFIGTEDDAPMNTVILWDWVSGEITDILSSDGDVRIEDFSFLTEDSFILTRVSTIDDTTSCSIDVFDHSKPNKLKSAPCIATFVLPELSPTVHVHALSARMDPPPRVHTDNTPTNVCIGDPAMPPKPFEVANSNKTFVLDWYICMGHNHFGAYRVFVPSGILVAALDAYRANPDSCDVSTIPTIIHWNDWGPKNTRLLRNSIRGNAFLWEIHGSRFISAPWRSALDEEDRETICILDFSKYSSKTWGATLPPLDASPPEDFVCVDIQPQNGVSDSFIVGRDQPTVIAAEGLLAEGTVTTELPCVVTMRDVSLREIHGTMVDDERIICIKWVEGETTEEIIIYTL